MADMIKNLPCKCHGVDERGGVWTKIVQYSKKGKVGIQTKKGNKWRRLQCTKTKKGYLQTNIHGRVIGVNRLIALNFLKNPFTFPEVHHKNGDSLDNRLLNLEWSNAFPERGRSGTSWAYGKRGKKW